MNQERVNSFFVQVQCANSLTDGMLLFYSGINLQESEVTNVLRFCFSLSLGCHVMPKDKNTKTSKIQSVPPDFLEEFM